MSSTRLELVWPNKDKFLLSPQDDNGKPVWVERTHPAAREVRLAEFTEAVGQVNDERPESDNLLFVGDSLDALRILNESPAFRREYRGKVKLIYIDPPFNTGQTFAHYDDWMEHSTWLSFMRDRLLLMKELLSPDGSIWVHLDDVEQHRMRSLLDEVFGSEQFVTNIVWQKADSPRMDAQQFSSSHDTICVYSKSANWQVNKFAPDGAVESDYPYSEVDGRRFKSSPLRKWGTNSNRSDRPKLWYPITSPDGLECWPIKPDGTEGNWRWQKSKVDSDWHLIQWMDKGSGLQPYVKEYMDAEKKPVPPVTWWANDQVGHNREAKAHAKRLSASSEVFSTPKPERLLQRVLQIGSNPGDIVFDCFAGSGTTAATAHKMGRRWVTVEIQPETVREFTKPRLSQVLDGSDTAGISESEGWAGGGGFRIVEIQQSFYAPMPFGVVLTDDATGPRFARAVAGQLGFDWEPGGGELCGRRGRMRLAVVDGPVGVEEVRAIVSQLEESERVTVVAQLLLPGAEDWLAKNSRGSLLLKSPSDVLKERRRRRRAIGVDE